MHQHLVIKAIIGVCILMIVREAAAVTIPAVAPPPAPVAVAKPGAEHSGLSRHFLDRASLLPKYESRRSATPAIVVIVTPSLTMDSSPP